MGEFIDDPFTDDIVIEVLQWLPVKFLFDLKCVSKRWYNIISSHYFRKLYQSQGRAEDDSLSTLLGFYRSEAEDAFIPTSLLAENHYVKSSISTADRTGYLKWDGDFFIGSSNGLLLYRNHHFMAYSIINPVTKRRHSLAQPHDRYVNVAIGFDVEKSHQKCNLGRLKFKLVCLLLPSSTTLSFTLQMNTYISETRRWTQSNLSLSYGSNLLRPFEYAVVINGVYYWLELTNRVLAYDSSGSQGWEEDSLQVIHLPERNLGITERSFILGESADGLLQYGRSDSFKIVIWVLSYGVDQDQWVFRHTVSFMLMCHQFPDIMSSCDLIFSLEDLQYESNANVPKLVAFHPLNPGTVFLRLGKLMISYCLDDGRLKLVHLQGKNCKPGDRISSSDHPREQSNRLVPYFSPTWASFYL